MSDVLGHECLYQVALDSEGRWKGLLPLVRVRSLLFGHYLVSMPFLNYGGPVGSPAAQQQLVRWAWGEAERSGAELLELRTRHTLAAAAPVQTTHRKVSVVLDLPEAPEMLWNEGFSSKLRSQIRRPIKEQMVVRFGADQVEPFYEVFCQNMRDLGTPVLPVALFERLIRVFPREVVFGVVYLGEQPVAAGCGFYWRSEFEMTWASSLRDFNRLAPNMLLYWSFMEEMIRRGARSFNFGRCTPDGGTHRFKLQWGGRDVPLPWLQWSPAGLSATPSPDRGVLQLAASAWQRVPLSVANRFGPMIARRIP